MSSTKKKRMSMLDSLAAAGAPAPFDPQPMISTNRALRSARDAVDAHQVWDLDPYQITDDRVTDRLDPEDVHDLRDAIETNGQTVPILVRRDPEKDDRYLLIYGRRRLEAIRSSDKVPTVRALVASMDEDSALRAQISENMARRDLSFIEKALFAKELVASGFGTQSRVAEVLTVTKSSISMALAIVDMVGADLARAIGAAHGVGRPRWEALGKAIEGSSVAQETLIEAADRAHAEASVAIVVDTDAIVEDPSMLALEAVERALPRPRAPSAAPKIDTATLKLGGKRGGSIKRTGRGVVLTLDDSPFADWFEADAQEILTQLHARWKQHVEE